MIEAPMILMKATCADCPKSAACSARVKFYANYCGSRRKALAQEIAINEDLCRKINWLKITTKWAA